MATELTETITPSARYYRLNREEHLAKKKEEYNLREDVIAKRAEKERKRAEKEAQKEVERIAKQIEKDKKVQERVLVAALTKRKVKTKPETVFLGAGEEHTAS